MNKRHYEHTLPNIRGSLSNTYFCSIFFLCNSVPEKIHISLFPFLVHSPFIPYFPFSSVKFPGFGNYFPAKQCVLPYFWKKIRMIYI